MPVRREGRAAYDAAVRNNQHFPNMAWTRGGYELLFRLCGTVETHLKLLTILGSAGRPQASSSSEPELRMTLRVRAELAQKLLDQDPEFEKLFLDYNEAARWIYGERVYAQIDKLKKGNLATSHLPNDLAADLRQKVKKLVSHLYRGMTYSRIHLSRLIRSQNNNRLN